MRTQTDISQRLAAVKRELEQLNKGQRYNFRSLTTKRSIMPGLFDYSFTAATANTYFRVTATPANGNVLPLNLDIRFRVGNPDVLAAPDYESATRFLGKNARMSVVTTGTHVLEVRYVTPVVETVYFKVIATGLDDYTITVAAM